MDTDFVESALIDLKYMMEIAAVTGRDADISMWQGLYDQLLANYRIWFFDDAGVAHQYCGKENLDRAQGNTIWVTKGLYISEPEETYETMLMNRFNRDYNPASSFGTFIAVKYPDSSHTIYGLINRGYTDTAATMIELCIRDVMRAGIFAESYDGGGRPVASDVRPSIFGCAMLIDTILASNGFMYETGSVKAVNLGMSGSVSKIHVRDKVYTVTVDAEVDRITLTEGDTTTTHDLPKGETKLFD